MQYLASLLLLFPFSLSSQEYVLDISNQTVDLSDLSFRINQVRDETGVADGHYGSVYTGLVNKERNLAFLHGMEHNLVVALLRNTVDKALPAATLSISFLRIEERVDKTSEHRRLHLEAALTMPGPDGELSRYGPYQVNRVEGGLDVTAGHAGALAKALAEIFQLLDEDVRAGRTSQVTAVKSGGRLRDGVYYSVLDFRSGRVDTTIQLKLTERRIARVGEEKDFYVADFAQPDSLSRRDLREIWGYRHEGTDFLYLQREYYSVQADAEGQLTVVVPGGLLDPTAMSKQGLKNAALVGAFGVAGALLAKPVDIRGNQEVFILDPLSGELKSRISATGTRAYLDSIMLLNVSGPGQPVLLADLNGRAYRIPPGAYLAVVEGGSLTLSAEGSTIKPLTKKIWGTDNNPTVYTLQISGRGKIVLERGSTDNAIATAMSAANGALRPAR
ncbi:hypothetical protein [Lewinella sp. IMCC34191]|uniref:hypothetical protein n=1 Tax=Lewinella sp. IMCC34191 TaxID=2259172 RepID=UPI000E23041F|nr:hypothetical protein [Lewinella sp. IMCC34191]